MNVTTASYSTVLKEVNKLLEKNNIVNIYTTLSILIFGVLGNTLSLMVLIYSWRNKPPRIAGSKYLILLTISNTAYLLVHFYKDTYPRAIYHFKLDYNSSYHLVDSNPICCKLLAYLTYSIRSFNTILTVCFSTERVLSAYCPNATFDSKFLLGFKLSILISLIIPSYILFLIELVPNSDTSKSIYDRYNLTRRFDFYSLKPTFGNFSCSALKKNYLVLLRFHFLTFFVIFLSYILVLISVLVVFIKLKNTKNFIFAYKSKTISTRGNSSSNDDYRLVESRSGIRKESFSLDSVSSRRHRKSQHLVNQEVHDTKILSSIAVSFIVLNTPYLCITLYNFRFAARIGEFNRSTAFDIVHMLSVRKIVSFAETLQLVHFALTGLLLFCFGQIFRLHAFNFFKKLQVFRCSRFSCCLP